MLTSSESDRNSCTMSLSPMTRTEQTAEKNAAAFTEPKAFYSGFIINVYKPQSSFYPDLFPGILPGLCAVRLAAALTGKTATSLAVWEIQSCRIPFSGFGAKSRIPGNAWSIAACLPCTHYIPARKHSQSKKMDSISNISLQLQEICSCMMNIWVKKKKSPSQLIPIFVFLNPSSAISQSPMACFSCSFTPILPTTNFSWLSSVCL